MKLYPRRTAAHALEFIEYVVGETPLPVQWVQTDRGTEFTAYDFQETLDAFHIKWQPNRPRKPHLNGQVEWVQRTDLQEFYATVDLSLPIEVLNEQLEGYATYYNFERVHGSTGLTPDKRYTDD